MFPKNPKLIARIVIVILFLLCAACAFSQTVRVENRGQITVAPRLPPFAPNQYFTFTSERSEVVIITFFSHDSVYHRQRCTIHGGTVNVRLETESLPVGTYFVRVERMETHRVSPALQY